MRSIENLVRTYPTKTGVEILKIQEQEKLVDEKRFELQNKSKLLFINDVNKNGGYYKGTFGLNQYFYYKFTNLRIQDNRIYCDVEKIVCFSGDEINVEKRFTEWQDLDKYGIEMYERVNEIEYNKISKYLDELFPKFWNLNTDPT